MKCTKKSCNGQLSITHTYTVSGAKFQRAVCGACELVHRLTVTATPVRERGEGAKAYAARLRRTRSGPEASPTGLF